MNSAQKQEVNVMQSASVHRFETRAVHGGHTKPIAEGAMVSPIFQSTTYAQNSIGDSIQHTYSRASNPTVARLEEAIASLDQRQHAICFATGMSASTALFFALLQSGDELICSDVVYGGTTRLIEEVLQPLGIEVRFIDTSDATALRRSISKRTKLVFVESPANPTLKIADIGALAEVTKRAGTLLAVDNTFLTPCLQNCRELGADIALYSTTKYFDGHNVTVGGALTLDDAQLAKKLRRLLKTMGLNQKPFEAWLTLQGIQTLPLRIHQQSRTALELASWLEGLPAIAHVFYPGLPSHFQFSLASKQQEAGGGIIAFELKSGFAGARSLVSSVQLITLAENLGATQSIVTHPASMTHADLNPHDGARIGITPGLIRLSVGLESFDDLKADLAFCLLNLSDSISATGEVTL